MENLLLVTVALLAHMPLYFQLPRWAEGFDPTLFPPNWIPQPNGFAAHMIAVHPIIWIALIAVIFIRISKNFGWRLARRCPLPSPPSSRSWQRDGWTP